MSKTTHAPEPWHASGAGIADPRGGTIVRSASGRRDRTDLAWVQEDNANRDRIVACVNACAGMDNPAAIPALVAAALLMHEAARLARQPFRASGVVDESSPGGQATAIRDDGTLVDRHAFERTAVAAMTAALNRLGLAKA